MIKINVTCLTNSKYKDSKYTIEMKDGSTLKELIIEAGISQRETVTYIVNGQKRDAGYTLANGDSVSIVPQILGG
jgi:sulfur carrier protein ThiS